MSKNLNNHPSLTNWELVSVNPKDKNWTWKSIFNFWANSIQTVIGFSLSGSVIPADSTAGVLTNLDYVATANEACLANAVISDINYSQMKL